jgi:hypothetical protein
MAWRTVIELLATWPRCDRSLAAARVPILLERRLGHAAVDQLIAAYRSGTSTRELASRYGVAKSSVIRVLRRHGMQLRPQGGRSWPSDSWSLRAEASLINNDVGYWAGPSADLCSYLRVERPQGLLAIDMENPRPNAVAVGSNFVALVGLVTFKLNLTLSRFVTEQMSRQTELPSRSQRHKARSSRDRAARVMAVVTRPTRLIGRCPSSLAAGRPSSWRS